jgi:N-acetylmuramoyl-L-alanine amidase
VPDPDRIYFDLHGARLAPELVGKSFDVTDDGFLRRIRIAQSSRGSARVVLDVSHVSEYSAFFLPNPWRLIIDIHASAANGAVLYGGDATPRSGGASAAILPQTNTPAKPAVPQDEVAGLAQQPRRVKATPHATTGPIAASVSGTTRAQQPNELEALATPPAFSAAPPQPARTRRTTAPAPANLIPDAPPLTAHEAAPASTGERSLVRTLGLKIGRIVIDAGHGGHDSGTLSADGLQEKDVVLDVALRLGKLLKQRLGADVIYTRDDDTFVPLETRTAIANKAQADLFISVHANSSSDPSARGVEVYYLNFTTSPEALEVAARENAVSDQSIYQLSDLVKKITLKDKIDESHEFASDVESSLFTGLEPGVVPGNQGLKDRGVKKAPFVVLIGANMPSILAEISFLTNPEDAHELRDPNYRERIAESLYRGVSRYVSGLSGVRLAQSGTRTNPSGRN